VEDEGKSATQVRYIYREEGIRFGDLIAEVKVMPTWGVKKTFVAEADRQVRDPNLAKRQFLRVSLLTSSGEKAPGQRFVATEVVATFRSVSDDGRRSNDSGRSMVKVGSQNGM
jgi:hypothetical protein